MTDTVNLSFLGKRLEQIQFELHAMRKDQMTHGDLILRLNDRLNHLSEELETMLKMEQLGLKNYLSGTLEELVGRAAFDLNHRVDRLDERMGNLETKLDDGFAMLADGLERLSANSPSPVRPT